MIFKNWEECLNEIKECNVPAKKKIGVFALSFLMSLLIIAAPAVLLVNLMIFKDYQKLLSFLMALGIIVFIFFIKFFYYQGVTEGKVKNLKRALLPEIIVYAMAVFVVLIIIYATGVMD